MHPSKQREERLKNAPSQLKSNFPRHLKKESRKAIREVEVEAQKKFYIQNAFDGLEMDLSQQSFDNKVYLFYDLILTLFYTC